MGSHHLPEILDLRLIGKKVWGGLGIGVQELGFMSWGAGVGGSGF